MASQLNEKKTKKKSIVKKILKWTGISFLILLIVLISLPFIFKDKLVEIVKQEINNSVNAKVEFGDFGLTLFSSFPNFSFDIQDVKVIGIEEFDGVELANIKNTEIELNLMSVLNGDKIKVKSIVIDEPTINVIVNKDSLANYDIAKESDESTNSDSTSESTKYEIGLNKLSISKANINYDDSIANVKAVINNLDFDLSGDFTQDLFDAKSVTTIEELSVSEGVVGYFSKTKVELKADLEIDEFKKYTLKENNLKLNELDIGFDGWIELFEDKTDLDLTFESKNTEFKSILSLVPAVYMNDFSNIVTKGKLALNGKANGSYTSSSYPSFDIDMKISDGYFKYPDLPNAADNINITSRVYHPEGDLDNMKIDLSKFHLELAQNPVDGNLKISNPMSDPNISGKVKADIDLDKLKTVIPMEENEKLNGKIVTDLNLAGRLSSLTNEQYQDFKADGELMVTDMLYASKDLPYEVNVGKMEMNFSPQFVNLSTFESVIGNSDIAAYGKIDNILPYVFKNEVLKGTINISSNKLDVDDLMRSVASDGDNNSEVTASDSTYEVIRVPAYYDMNIVTNIKELIYDGTQIKNVKGNVAVKDEIANLSGVKMDMLDGNITLNGSYNTKTANPLVNFNYKVKNVDIVKTAQFFKSIETIAPVAKHCKGRISTNLKVVSKLNENMEPIYSSINGDGGLFSDNIKVSGVKVLQKFAEILKLDKLSSQDLKKLDFAFEFKEGRAFVNPFNIKLSGIPAEITGSTGFDQTIDYKIKMVVPKDRLGGKANEVFSDLLGKAKIGGKPVAVPSKIPVTFFVLGTVTSPKITYDLKNKVQNVVTDIKDKVVDTINKTFNKEVEKIMKEAEKRAQQARDLAKTNADKLRNEGVNATKELKLKADAAEVEAKKIADQEAEKISNKGGNMLEKIANKKAAEYGKKKAYEQIAKTKKEAYSKAEIPQNQAEDKANKVEAEAEKRANQIMENARKQADAVKR